MKLKEYLIDKRHLILFMIIMMGFISLVVYLDNKVEVNVENIMYINAVSYLMFICYLSIDWFRKKRYYEILKSITENNEENVIESLIEPITYEQKLYDEIIRNIYGEYSEKIEKLYVDKKDNLEFTTSWVHEIKTPIAVSRLIIENSEGKSKEEILDSLEEEIDKIDNYVEQSLYYSKIDDFSKDYFIDDIDCERLIKDGVKKNAKTFINKKIAIEMNNLEITLSSDKKWLLFILNQILSNSLKYTSVGGKIKITGEVEEKEKRIIIEDNGIGIKEEDINRVFNKGFTGHTGRKEYKSTGMGLYLAKKLALKLGHDITIESTYGEYTKVTIHFPKLIDYLNVAKK